MTVRRRVSVHGRVQGVGFRFGVVRAAGTRGVNGWVRNCADGSVEAVLEGDASAVESVVRFCREGPRGAAVSRVDVREEEPEGLRGFDVR
jgi:acylphosphatase